MYNNSVSNSPCECVGTEPVNMKEETLQSAVVEILDMARHLKGISSNIRSNLFGAEPQPNKNEPGICCLSDALNEARATMNETIITLEAVLRKL